MSFTSSQPLWDLDVPDGLHDDASGVPALRGELMRSTRESHIGVDGSDLSVKLDHAVVVDTTR